MAAVLCGGIGKACSGCFECMGAVCMAPFKLCGACCEGCSQCCQNSCAIVTGCCSSSFCFYITVTCALNIPPIVLGLMDLPNLGDGCQGSMWLLIFWILCVINIAAAFYMSRAIEQDTTILPSNDQQGMSNFDASSGVSRIKHLFCYDMWMAVYILVLFGYFGWLLVGGAYFAASDDDEDEACDDVGSRVGIAYGFGWAFFFMGGCALCVSLCCGAFSSRPSSTPTYNSNPQTQSTSAAAAAPAASQTASTTSKPSKNGYNSSTTATATPVVPASASAPPEVEVPVASATPIYDEAPSKS